MAHKNGGRRIPTALRVLKGNDKPYLMNDQEPKPTTSNLGPPDHLSDSAKRHWLTISKQLEQAGIIADTDTVAFGVLCESIAQWIEITSEIDKAGMLVDGRDGFLVLNPAFNASDKLASRIRLYCTEYGMTPASRPKVNAIEDKKTAASDPWAALG